MSDTNNSFAPGSSPPATTAADDATRPDNETAAVFATFNILHGRITNGPVSMEAFVEAVRSLGADVIGLQEVDQAMLRTSRVDMARLAGEKTGMAFYFGKAFRRFDLGKYGNALLAAGQLTATTLKLPRRRRSSEKRVAVEAKVRVKGVEWTVVNTHLSLDAVESESQLKLLVAKLNDLAGPCVLMGDFNRFPADVTPLIPEGWQIAESGPTWPAWGPEKRIDYIVVRNATITSVEVRTTAISDHCALVAKVNPC